jgi:hypothetical protein
MLGVYHQTNTKMRLSDKLLLLVARVRAGV